MIFINIPKNASSSINEAMGLKTNYKFAKNYDDLETLFSFAVVRNPYDRAVSTYNYLRQDNYWFHGSKKHPFYETAKNLTFPQFIKWYEQNQLTFKRKALEMNEQYIYVTDNNNNIIVDFIARYENLNDDWKTICKRINKDIPLKHINKSKRSNYEDYYDQETKDIVYNVYKKDFELFYKDMI